MGGGGGINWQELFPTRLSGGIFITYMSLFVAQGILVTASQDADSGYSYNTVTVVLLTEVLKLITSSLLYIREHSFRKLIEAIRKDVKVLLLYCVPAFLYCLYNNLAFVNLSKFDPTSYYLLLQIRVVITGILFQLIFKKHLSRKQWFSLILLTFGCMVKQVNFSAAAPSISSFFNVNLFFILVQTVCSCLAGVYNEYLLKRDGSNVNIFVQNVFMYLDSILFNAFVLAVVEGNLISSAFSGESLAKLMHFKVLIIMVNNAAIGIITSFFLKYLNSILKTFASALELLFTAILCYLLFGIPVHLNTVLSIGIVSAAIYLYSQSPINNNSSSSGGGNNTVAVANKRSTHMQSDVEEGVSLLLEDSEENEAEGKRQSWQIGGDTSKNTVTNV